MDNINDLLYMNDYMNEEQRTIWNSFIVMNKLINYDIKLTIYARKAFIIINNGIGVQYDFYDNNSWVKRIYFIIKNNKISNISENHIMRAG